MLFKVSGKFSNGHTFTINPVDGADASEALAAVKVTPEIKDYGSPIVSVTVKALSGSRRKVRISDAPAAERKSKTEKTTAAKTEKPRKR